MRKVLIAVAVTIPAAIATVVWTNHNSRVAEFRSARNECQHSIASTVAELAKAGRRAHERAFTPPPPINDTDPNLFIAIKKVGTDCFGPPLLSGNGDDWQHFNSQGFIALNAWVSSNMESNVPGTSYEEALLGGAADYFGTTLSERVHGLPEPSLWDSVRALAPG